MKTNYKSNHENACLKRCVLRSVLKQLRSFTALIFDGNLFQSLGADAINDLSPKVFLVMVLGGNNCSSDWDRNIIRPNCCFSPSISPLTLVSHGKGLITIFKTTFSTWLVLALHHVVHPSLLFQLHYTLYPHLFFSPSQCDLFLPIQIKSQYCWAKDLHIKTCAVHESSLSRLEDSCCAQHSTIKAY